MTRDGPSEKLPGLEIKSLVTKGLLLVLYIIRSLFYHRAVVILSGI